MKKYRQWASQAISPFLHFSAPRPKSRGCGLLNLASLARAGIWRCHIPPKHSCSFRSKWPTFCRQCRAPVMNLGGDLQNSMTGRNYFSPFLRSLSPHWLSLRAALAPSFQAGWSNTKDRLHHVQLGRGEYFRIQNPRSAVTETLSDSALFTNAGDLTEPTLTTSNIFDNIFLIHSDQP